MLESSDIQLSFAENGSQGVELYKRDSNKIYHVLLDIIMTEMVDREKFVHMKKFNHEIKTILMSGFNQNIKSDNILSDGLSEYVQKPFKLNELLKAVVTATNN